MAQSPEAGRSGMSAPVPEKVGPVSLVPGPCLSASSKQGKMGRIGNPDYTARSEVRAMTEDGDGG